MGRHQTTDKWSKFADKTCKIWTIREVMVRVGEYPRKKNCEWRRSNPARPGRNKTITTRIRFDLSSLKIPHLTFPSISQLPLSGPPSSQTGPEPDLGGPLGVGFCWLLLWRVHMTSGMTSRLRNVVSRAHNITASLLLGGHFWFEICNRGQGRKIPIY